MVENLAGIYGGQRLDQHATRVILSLSVAAACRHLAHQPMKANAVRRERRVAFVRNGLTVDQRETTQHGHRLVEPFARECRGKRLAKYRSCLGEQEYRDRLRSEQRGINEQRLSGGMNFRRFLDGERERLRYCHSIVVFHWRVARVTKELCWRSLKTPSVFGERNVELLAIGRRLLMRERESIESLRQSDCSGPFCNATGGSDKIIGANLLRPKPNFDGRRNTAPSAVVRGDQHLG